MHRIQGRLILYLGAIVALLSLHSTLPRFDVLMDEAILVQGPLSQHPGYGRGGAAAGGERREVFRMPVKLSGGPEHLVKFTILDVQGTGGTEIQTGFRIQDENRVFQTRVDSQVRGKKVIGVIRHAESSQLAIFRVLIDPAFTITLADISFGSFNFAGRMLRWGARLGAIILWAVIILELLVASRVVGSALLCASALVGFLYQAYPQPFFTGRGDTQWNVPLALSILQEGDMDLNEYAAEIRHQKVGAAKHLGGEWRLYWPNGISLLNLPSIFIGNIAFDGSRREIEVFTSRMQFAAACFVMFLLAYRSTGRLGQSYALSFIFALGTLNVFYMSGELWTHGGVELMLLLSLLWIKKAEQEKEDLWLCLAGLPLAFAYVVRPTAILFLLAFAVYVAVFHRRSFPWFAAFAALVLIVFSLWSYRVYGQFVPSYYRASRLALDVTFWEALLGQSFSPNRGLFVFTPLFLFSAYGAYLAFKTRDRFLSFAALILVPYFLATATFGHWWGGFSYGPRLFTDAVPLLVTLLVLPVKRLDLSFKKRRLYTSFFLVAFAFSFFVGQRALYDPAPHQWNADPVSVDRRPERIWDWKDWQIFR